MYAITINYNGFKEVFKMTKPVFLYLVGKIYDVNTLKNIFIKFNIYDVFLYNPQTNTSEGIKSVS